MSSLKFAETHNVVTFLEKPVESDRFAEIIDFLKASSVHYALTVNPIIYTSCIEQFWATAKSSIRRDLHLDDADGTDCLPTATIFEELAFFINQQLGNMSHHKKIFINPFHTKKVFANMKRPGKDFSRRITPLFDTMMVQPSEEVGEDSDHPTDSTQVPILDQPSTSSKPKKKKPSKKTSRTTCLKRLKKVGMSRRVDSSKDQESLGVPEDSSKQGRSIADIDADIEVTLVDETQVRQDDELMFDTGVLDTDEMHVEAKVDEKDE
ncbi:hypothetical protein Tco_1559414, partial [Tanacetum coccineum]